MHESYRQLIDELITDGVLRTPSLIEAFRVIDRRDFVPDTLAESAYHNSPLPIGMGQTISQPWTVAFMLELLQPYEGENILDIGAGSGWQTCLLAQVVGGRGHITALEIIPELFAWGKENINHYSFIDTGIVEVHCMSGFGGYPERASFDKIIAAAAGESVPEAWLAQTKVGGCIVAPIGSSVWRLTRISDQNWTKEMYSGFTFVPLISR